MISEEELEERIRQGVRDELAEVRRELAKAFGVELTDKYIRLPDAWKQLGCKNYKEAKSYIDNGSFRAGKEYQARPTGPTRQIRYYVNVQKALKRLDEITRESV